MYVEGSPEYETCLSECMQGGGTCDQRRRVCPPQCFDCTMEKDKNGDYYAKGECQKAGPQVCKDCDKCIIFIRIDADTGDISSGMECPIKMRIDTE